jgi:Holliday junction resolvase
MEEVFRQYVGKFVIISGAESVSGEVKKSHRDCVEIQSDKVNKFICYAHIFSFHFREKE